VQPRLVVGYPEHYAPVGIPEREKPPAPLWVLPYHQIAPKLLLALRVEERVPRPLGRGAFVREYSPLFQVYLIHRQVQDF
jgi:hypothetical protein